jgi:hypothetical protein
MRCRIWMILTIICATWVAWAASVAAMRTRPATIPDAPTQPAGTIISSDVTTDTTWTLAGSPYLATADVTVLPGVTLTVEQGVAVQFQQLTGLAVRGRLTAFGTYTEPITFTATTPQLGWWKGIFIKGAISAPITGSMLSYATVEYGGAQNLADLYVEYAEVKVSHGTFRRSAADGIYSSYSGVAHIANSGFVSNTGYAVQFYDGSVNPALWNLTATGNGYDAVGLGLGTRQGAHEWAATGIPYILMADETVAPGATLTIDPGVTVQALQGSGLTVNGRLMAMGTVSAPITFTGYFTGAPTPGWWKGLHVQGDISAPSAAARLDQAVVEYSGYASNPNVYVQYGRAAISNSRIQASSGDGVYISYGAGGSTIAASHILSNAGYGVYNQDAQVVVAANDWWGAASGPQVDLINSTDCNPGGAGSRVSAGVAFRPFLTSVMQDPGSFAPGDVRTLTLTPLRWFVPADGNSRAYVTLTLRDGAGNPVPGRHVILGNTTPALRAGASVGTASGGGITDVRGQTFAYVTSNVTGESTLTGVLQDAATCEYARSASATVTFTPVSAGLDVMPGSPAPYLSGGIEVDPLPVTQGQPTTLQARITNPTTSTLIVTGAFDYVQSSIGLVFGPILGSPKVVTIPPLGQGTFQTQWIPPVQGHYCVAANLLMKMDDVPGESPIQKTYQRNWDVLGGDLWSDQERSALAHLAAMNMPPTVDLLLPAVQAAREAARRSSCLNNIKASLIAASLATAQPRLDYRAITLPQKPVTSPLSLDSGFSPEFIAAYNGYMDAMADVIAYERAIKIALDRYAGAAEAGDLQWASQQAAVKGYYQKLLGRSAEMVALYRDTLSRTPDVSGLNVWVSAADVISYQNHLRTQGLSPDELDAAHALGMSDAEIEAMRQAYLAADPPSLAGNVLDYQARLAATLQQLGEALTGSTNMPPQAGLMAVSVITPNNLARIYASVTDVAVGNLLTQTAAVELRIRRVDIPSDWTAAVTPALATLAPGVHITATVTVEAWSPVAQGYQARVAVEGYISNTLIGGVALDVLVPQAAVFDGKLRVYLPLVLR